MVAPIDPATRLARGQCKSAQASSDGRDEFRKFLAAFGVVKGGEYFASGKSFDEAMEHFRNSQHYGANLAKVAAAMKLPGSTGRKPAA